MDVVPTGREDIKVNVAKPNLKEEKTVQFNNENNQLKWNTKILSGKSFSTQSVYQIDTQKDREVSFHE